MKEDLLIMYKDRLCVTCNAQQTTSTTRIDGEWKSSPMIEMKNLYGDLPPKNEECYALIKGNVFLCIFAHKMRLDVIKKVNNKEILDKIWQLQENYWESR